ncbi:IclR family transcriptional regulator [Fusobacterium sp.]|uniref:IclR family transcriptional regulator n=1 Tax=Fusobacterium sp. TaxID=68766 RepID=UPI0025BC6FF6|nr:IclR family transcriptional regulator [Fusobacterium sp.]
MSSHKPTERVINILNVVSKNPNKLTLSNISKQLNIPKSTLSPILKTLVESELLNFDIATQTYAVGLETFQIGQSYLNSINGLDIVKSHMRSIVNECNETCQLGINHRNEVLYLTKVESRQPIKLLSSIGRNLPLYCTGLGRALLFEYSEEDIRELYSEELDKFTEYTINNLDDIVDLVNRCREEDYAYEKQEITTDACCIAVPIRINNSIQAALGVSFPVVRATEEHINDIISLLKLHSKMISHELSNLNINHIL